jgi:hypothetical protein
LSRQKRTPRTEFAGSHTSDLQCQTRDSGSKKADEHLNEAYACCNQNRDEGVLLDQLEEGLFDL